MYDIFLFGVTLMLIFGPIWLARVLNRPPRLSEEDASASDALDNGWGLK